MCRLAHAQAEVQFAGVAVGTRWAVLFHRQVLTATGNTTLRLRRFDGSTPRDSGAMQAAPLNGRAGMITALESGDLAMAWMSDIGDIYARVVDDAAPALVETDVIPVATMSHIEARPVVAPIGNGFLVMWEDGSSPQIRFAVDMTTTLPPEAMLLAMELDAGMPPASVVPSPDGLWFAWTGYGFSTAARALGVFHLPRD